MSSKVYTNAALVFLFAILCFTLSAPVPEVEQPEPKLAHHAIAYFVCDRPVGILFTTVPEVVWYDAIEDGEATREVVDLLNAAKAADRAFTIQHWHPGCSNPPVVPDTFLEV